VVDLTCSYNVDVFSHVVFVMVFFDHAFGDGLHVADVSQNRKADLLSFEDASMCDLYSSLERHRFPGFSKFSLDSASLVLYVSFAIERVSEHISNNADSSAYILPERCNHIRGVFSRSVGIQIGAHVLNL